MATYKKKGFKRKTKDLDKNQSEQILEVLNTLEELDDVQNIFTNANMKIIQ